MNQTDLVFFGDQSFKVYAVYAATGRLRSSTAFAIAILDDVMLSNSLQGVVQTYEATASAQQTREPIHLAEKRAVRTCGIKVSPLT